jgi:CHAT domain-containing protein/tetratricopeptide (TPR) repeat protein
VHRSGRPYLGWSALLLAFFVLCSAPPLRAQAPAAEVQHAFDEAEVAFVKGELAKADRLYHVALESKIPAIRRRCYDQLLILGADRGQHDEVVRLGEAYREWLANPGDPKRIREVTLQLGLSYCNLGHYRRAERELLAAVRDSGPPLDPGLQVGAWTELAHIAERYRNNAAAAERWRTVERLALRQIEAATDAKSRPSLIEYTQRLADSFRFLGRNSEAVQRLEALLPLHDELHDPAGKSKTLAMLAERQVVLGKTEAADKSLRDAIELRSQPGAGDSLAEADLWADLGEIQAGRDEDKSAGESRTKALELYQKTLQEPGDSRGGVYRHSQAFWKLQQLHQRTRDFNKALTLVDAEAGATRDLTIPDTRIKTEVGFLRVFLGSYPEAGRALREALAVLEKQKPVNLIDLPRTLNSLAVVEQSTDGVDRAEELALRCLQLYKDHGLPDDTVLIEAYNLLGTNSTLRGNHAEAAERFREGVARCAPLGRKGERLLASLSVNLALLHKSQGDLTEAARELAKAGEAYRRFAAKDSIDLVFYDCALASLYAEQNEFDKAADLAERVLERCRQLEVTNGPLMTTSLHCRALRHLVKGRLEAADADWRAVLKLQEAARQEAAMPRTLNYLGLTAERQGQADRARELYTRSLDLGKKGKRSVPTTSFVTLWRLAALLDQAGRREEARGLLVQAVDLVEAARLQTFGDAQQRTGFFAQFAPAFDDLVQRDIRDGRTDAAYEYAARSRSRALLDQLQLSGVDPRRELTGPRGEELAAREAALMQKISGLRARLQLIPAEEADQERSTRLVAELDAAQKEYAGVWRDILNASPTYHDLAAANVSQDLARKTRRVLGPHDLLLCYHLGRTHSYLFLVGPGEKPVQAIPLTISAALPDALARTARDYLSESGADRRGIGLRPKPPEATGPPPDVPAGQTVPLTQARARRLVDSYRIMLESSEFGGKRGIGLKPKDPAARAPAVDTTAFAEALLPSAVKERIVRDGVETLIVVPDGPLHKLPLEALVLQTKPTPRYVLDDYPPMIYAPSAAALVLLANRPAPTGDEDSLLTVCNPAYPQTKAMAPVPPTRGTRQAVGFAGQLIPLPFTSEESKRIRKFFPTNRTVTLEGDQATEARIRAEIGTHAVIHIAAHGFADASFGNIFGALAVTPPAQPQSAENDGFLSLYEIYRLPLSNCRLAVLSACETNVGPQPPLEAGVTLASAFLAAGVRRVVASHWSVDDESTAELTSSFFQNLRRGSAESTSYAKALYEAKKKVRSTERWASPFYWAPFVLIGTPERAAK